MNFPKLDKLNSNNLKDNISVSVISGKKAKMNVEDLKHKPNNTVKYLSNSEQIDSDMNNKNNINIFNPEINKQFDNINEKKAQ